ncbi:hypothetical protein [Coraliomargarita parva]|nr:hypothetical protein [Coraliomargarita parva]
MKRIGSISAFQNDLDFAAGSLVGLGFDVVDLILVENPSKALS